MAKSISATPHDSYSSSIGVLGCKINTDRVAYWPNAIDCDNICVKVSYKDRSVHLLRIDKSEGAHDISYDAWSYLQTGETAAENPITGGGVAMDYEEVDASECADLIYTDGAKLPLSASNSINFLASCLEQPSSYVAKNHVLFNICDSLCSLGYDEECTLDLSVSNQPSCKHTLGLTVELTTTGGVVNTEYETGNTVDAATGDSVSPSSKDTSSSDEDDGSSSSSSSSSDDSSSEDDYSAVAATTQQQPQPTTAEAPETSYVPVSSVVTTSSAPAVVPSVATTSSVPVPAPVVESTTSISSASSFSAAAVVDDVASSAAPVVESSVVIPTTSIVPKVPTTTEPAAVPTTSSTSTSSTSSTTSSASSTTPTDVASTASSSYNHKHQHGGVFRTVSHDHSAYHSQAATPSASAEDSAETAASTTLSKAASVSAQSETAATSASPAVTDSLASVNVALSRGVLFAVAAISCALMV